MSSITWFNTTPATPNEAFAAHDLSKCTDAEGNITADPEFVHQTLLHTSNDDVNKIVASITVTKKNHFLMRYAEYFVRVPDDEIYCDRNVHVYHGETLIAHTHRRYVPMIMLYIISNLRDRQLTHPSMICYIDALWAAYRNELIDDFNDETWNEYLTLQFQFQMSRDFPERLDEFESLLMAEYEDELVLLGRRRRTASDPIPREQFDVPLNKYNYKSCIEHWFATPHQFVYEDIDEFTWHDWDQFIDFVTGFRYFVNLQHGIDFAYFCRFLLDISGTETLDDLSFDQGYISSMMDIYTRLVQDDDRVLWMIYRMERAGVSYAPRVSGRWKLTLSLHRTLDHEYAIEMIDTLHAVRYLYRTRIYEVAEDHKEDSAATAIALAAKLPFDIVELIFQFVTGNARCKFNLKRYQAFVRGNKDRFLTAE